LQAALGLVKKSVGKMMDSSGRERDAFRDIQAMFTWSHPPQLHLNSELREGMKPHSSESFTKCSDRTADTQ
jgi:hypothetical protein